MGGPAAAIARRFGVGDKRGPKLAAPKERGLPARPASPLPFYPELCSGAQNVSSIPVLAMLRASRPRVSCRM